MRKGYLDKRGITLIELIVAMAIFLVVITLAVGGFLSLLRLQTQTQTMTDVQQNGRIAIEQITRLARQAESLEITHLDPSGHTNHTGDSDYQDQLKITIGGGSSCFKVEDDRLKRFTSCGGTGLTLSSSDVKIKRFYFDKSRGVPPELYIYLTVESVNPSIGNEKDTINLNTSVLLTGLK